MIFLGDSIVLKGTQTQALSGIPKRKKADVLSEENTLALDKLCSDMSYSAFDYELKVNESAIYFKLNVFKKKHMENKTLFYQQNFYQLVTGQIIMSCVNNSIMFSHVQLTVKPK